VLTAMGLSPMRARGCVRFSLGIYNTDDEVDYLLKNLPSIVARLRSISPPSSVHPDNGTNETETAHKRHKERTGTALAHKNR